MKVNVSQIRRTEGGTIGFELVEDFPPFQFGGEVVSFASPVHVQLQVTNTGKSLFAMGTACTSLKAACGRCLEEFIQPLDAPYEDEWVFGQQASEEQDDTVLMFEKDEIEISERVFEQIVLALPMKFICSPECQGLCPSCGANLNASQCNCVKDDLDPRLAELAKWRSED